MSPKKLYKPRRLVKALKKEEIILAGEQLPLAEDQAAEIQAEEVQASALAQEEDTNTFYFYSDEEDNDYCPDDEYASLLDGMFVDQPREGSSQ